MAKYVRMVLVSTLVALVAVSAAYAAPAANHATAAKHARRGARAEGRTGAMRGMMGLGRGYLEPTQASKKLWDEMGKLEVEQHKAEWDLFILMAQHPQNAKKLHEQRLRMREIGQRMVKVRDNMKPYWHALPARTASRRTETARHGKK